MSVSRYVRTSIHPQKVFPISVKFGMYTVSQKTSHLWLAITLTVTHMNGFWYFLAEMLLIK